MTIYYREAQGHHTAMLTCVDYGIFWYLYHVTKFVNVSPERFQSYHFMLPAWSVTGSKILELSLVLLTHSNQKEHLNS